MVGKARHRQHAIYFAPFEYLHLQLAVREHIYTQTWHVVLTVFTLQKAGKWGHDIFIVRRRCITKGLFGFHIVVMNAYRTEKVNVAT